MQRLNPAVLSGVVPVQYPIIQSMARNRWIDINNESSVTLSTSLGGRIYLIPPHSTVRYAMDNTETFVNFLPLSAANPATDTVSGTVYNEQDNIPIAIERGASAADILPITSAEIADGAVIAAKVATDAINTVNIVNSAVVTAKVASGAITNPLLATNAVATANIQPGAVANAQLAALAVANANIQTGAVATAQIADGSVTTTKIANLAVTNALIANAAVGTAQIANAAITTALIQTAAITDALISNVSASKITAGTISATISIIAPTITGGTLQTSSSGKRVVIDSVNSDRVRFFGGNASETFPGAVYNAGTNLVMAAPTITGFGNASSFQVNADGTSDFVGTIIRGPTVGNSQGSAPVGPSGPWTVGVWTGIGPTVTFQKRQPTSSLLVMYGFSAFTSTGGPISFGILADIGSTSTIRSSHGAYVNPANSHTPFVGIDRILGGAAVGNYSLRIAVNSSASFQADANDYSSLAVIEVGP